MKDLGVIIFSGTEAQEQFDPELEALNEIRAKELRISTQEAFATSKLLLDVYRSLFSNKGDEI